MHLARTVTALQAVLRQPVQRLRFRHMIPAMDIGTVTLESFLCLPDKYCLTTALCVQVVQVLALKLAGHV
jgi:hydroxyacyl-ACP dehydratase HTD2-like protein with hotdog domain